MKSTYRCYFSRVLFAFLVALSMSYVWAADYESLITQARKQLEGAQFSAALNTANDSVRANPSDYRGHYYVAMAQMSLGQISEAEAAVARSLKLAPPNAKAGVERLASAIRSSKKAPDQSTTSETFLKCSGTKTTRVTSLGKLTEPIAATYKIGNNSISEWDESKIKWRGNMCEKVRDKGIRYTYNTCDLNENFYSWRMSWETDEKGYLSKRSDGIKINRKTAEWASFWTVTDIEPEKGETVLLVQSEGTCQVTPDPSKVDRGPNKF